jgi:DNA-binding NarL/FixJ family response regulator
MFESNQSGAPPRNLSDAARIRVLIVEDDPLQMRLIADSVASDSRLELVGTAATLTLGRSMFDLDRPDVLLLDLGLPDGRGVDLVRYATQTAPDCDVVVVTMHTDDESVVDSLAAGAAGYIAKDAMPHEMARVVLEVRAGGAPITSAIARRVLRRFRTVAASGGSAALGGAPDACDANPAGGPEDADRLLSIRELQVLNLCAKGLSFCDVAAVLEVSLHTVRTYVKRIYRKLAVGSRAEAVFEAQQLGLI